MLVAFICTFSLIMLTFAIYYLGTCNACIQACMFLKIVANQYALNIYDFFVVLPLPLLIFILNVYGNILIGKIFSSTPSVPILSVNFFAVS